MQARALLCFTRRGYMAAFLSRCRPDAPIFAFTGVLKGRGRTATS
jgi:pyruvate kinase